ncbi:MAG TPA: hypothetical protein VMU54_22490, partial [Planctomycetota bacterium]|nr:hypothetical protein [Planctomycetota bacterium]
LGAALLFLCALLVRVSGGWVFKLGTHTFSLVHPGPPLTLGILLLGIRGAWLVWRHRELLRATIPPRYQAYFWSVAVPLFTWFFVIFPMRLTHYLNWVIKSPAHLSRASVEYWTFYPKFLFHAAAATPGLFLAILVLVGLGFVGRKVPEKMRFLRWAVVVTALIVTAHSARQQRFILPFLPAALLLASCAIAQGIGRSWSPGLRWGSAALAAATLLAFLLPGFPGLYRERLRSLAEGSFTPEALGYREILRRISDEAAAKPSVRILGSFPGLSHHLFEWELRRQGDLRKRELSFDLPGPAERPGEGPQTPQQVCEQWLAESPEELVFTIEPIDFLERMPEPTGIQGEVSPDTYADMRFFRSTDRFVRTGEWLYPAAGLRVLEYALVGERPQPKKKTKHRADR